MMSLFFMALPLLPYGVLLAVAPSEQPLGAPVPASLLGPHPGSPGDEAEETPFSARKVAEASKGWEWKRLESPGWKLLMAEHFVLRGDVGVEELRRVGAYLEAFHRVVQDRLAGDPSGIMFSARVYKDRPDFLRYAAALGAPNAESLYDPRQGDIVLCLEGRPGTHWLQRALAHEFVHAYMDRVWKRTGPLWFAEGAAEYFSNFTLKDGRVEPGAPDRRALLLLEIDPPAPLKEFVRFGRDEMYGITYAHRYAQAWSLVHYLFSTPEGIQDLLLRGGPPGDWDRLEEGWRGHLKELQKAR